jgi:hypothetical protein
MAQPKMKNVRKMRKTLDTCISALSQLFLKLKLGQFSRVQDSTLILHIRIIGDA